MNETSRGMEIHQIDLPSGCRMAAPLERMLRFCHEEYSYYDGLPQGDPNRIEPLDVLAIVSVNGLIPANAAKIRAVHTGLAARCNSILASIDTDAKLLDKQLSLEPLKDLFHAAVSVNGVLIPTATKVLHRKRPLLIPMLDNVVLEHYLGQPLPSATQYSAHAAG